MRGVECVGVLEGSMSCGIPALHEALQHEDILAESLTQFNPSRSSGFSSTTEKGEKRTDRRATALLAICWRWLS